MADSGAHFEYEILRTQRPPRTWIARHNILSTFDNCIIALALAEATSIIFAAFASKLLYIDLLLGQAQPIWPYLAPAPLLAVALYLSLKRAGLYGAGALLQPVVAYGRIFGELVKSFFVLLGILYILKDADWYSRGWFLTWFGLSGIALISVRIAGMRRVRQFVAQGQLRQRIAMYGSLEFITAMKARIEGARRSDAIEGLYLAKPTGICQDDLVPDGGLNELKGALALGRYDTIIIGLPAEETASIQAAVNDLASYSTELLLCTKLDPHPIAVQGTRVFGTLRADVVNLVPLSESSRFLKTALDYVVAGIGLLLFAPLLALVALAIKFDSPGPVFFRQRRYGQNNRIFRIFKFRTMAVAEDGQYIKQAERNDPRVTRVGWLLRRTSIDELPQLLNVLAGDMSIVGPRPHALAHDQLFELQLDLFSRRRRVRPGLTGWAQVHGLRGATKTTKDICSRVQHDIYYIDNWSIWLDIEIMVRTVFVFFRGAF